MRKPFLLGILGLAVLAASLHAVVPQKWELRTREDYLKGKFDGISVSYDGMLALAPKEEKIAAPQEEFFLSVLATAEGITFLGTGHGGKVYRIGKDGKGEVWFQAPEMDVTCLVQDRKRMLFKAAQNHILGLEKAARGDVVAGSGGNGLVYKIATDGRASVLFETPYEEVRSLAVDREGQIYAAAPGTPTRAREDEKKVLFGTGGKGRIYSVDREERVALLLQQSSEQVYQLVPLDSKIYVLSNNPCYFGLLLTEQRFAGEYTSPVLDARTLTSWGRVVWDADVAAGASVQLQSRSGNTTEPNATWSDWSPSYAQTADQILSPKARFLQVKVLFRTQTGKSTPVFNRLTVVYLQSNVAPSVTRLEF